MLEEEATEFDSLDMAVHMLFHPAPHSYTVCRAIFSRIVATQVASAITRWKEHLLYPRDTRQTRRNREWVPTRSRLACESGVENPSLVPEYFVRVTGFRQIGRLAATIEGDRRTL